MNNEDDFFVYNTDSIEDAAMAMYDVYYSEYDDLTRPPVKNYLKKWVFSNQENPLFFVLASLLFRVMIIDKRQ